MPCRNKARNQRQTKSIQGTLTNLIDRLFIAIHPRANGADQTAPNFYRIPRKQRTRLRIRTATTKRAPGVHTRRERGFMAKTGANTVDRTLFAALNEQATIQELRHQTRQAHSRTQNPAAPSNTHTIQYAENKYPSTSEDSQAHLPHQCTEVNAGIEGAFPAQDETTARAKAIESRERSTETKTEQKPVRSTERRGPGDRMVQNAL